MGVMKCVAVVMGVVMVILAAEGGIIRQNDKCDVFNISRRSMEWNDKCGTTFSLATIEGLEGVHIYNASCPRIATSTETGGCTAVTNQISFNNKFYTIAHYCIPEPIGYSIP